MKKRNLLYVFSSLFSIICILNLPISSAQRTATLRINPPETTFSTAQIGSTIAVNLTVSNIHNLWGWKLNLTWNPQILNLTDITEGPFLSSAGDTLYTWVPSSSSSTRSQGYLKGVVADVLLTPDGVDGSGVLATIYFQVLGSGVSSISISGSALTSYSPNLSGETIDATISNGVVTIQTTTTPSPTTPVTPSPTVPEFQTLTIISMMCVLLTTTLLIVRKRKTGLI